jgi:cytochrome c-type biogenesis protein CcmH/NrfF
MIAKLATLAVLLAALAPASALAAQPKTTLNDLEDEVMCDTCNVPLNVADADRADQERVAIKRLIDQGLTKQQIKDRLKAQYGPGILATPEDSGFTLAVWWVPVVVVLAVLALLAALVPRWKRRPRTTGATPPESDLSAVDTRRLNEDLARYDT